MLTMNGTLLNVLKREPRPGSDRTFDPYGQAQLQTTEELEDGQQKIALHTLSIPMDQVTEFEALKGREIDLPVRVYVRNGAASFLVQGGAKPVARRRPVAAE
jgi:hypothetical protein